VVTSATLGPQLGRTRHGRKKEERHSQYEGGEPMIQFTIRERRKEREKKSFDKYSFLKRDQRGTISYKSSTGIRNTTLKTLGGKNAGGRSKSRLPKWMERRKKARNRRSTRRRINASKGKEGGVLKKKDLSQTQKGIHRLRTSRSWRGKKGGRRQKGLRGPPLTVRGM